MAKSADYLPMGKALIQDLLSLRIQFCINPTYYKNVQNLCYRRQKQDKVFVVSEVWNTVNRKFDATGITL